MISIMHYHNVNRTSACFDIPGKLFVISFVKIIKMCTYITIAVHQSPLVSKFVKLCFFLKSWILKYLPSFNVSFC